MKLWRIITVVLVAIVAMCAGVRFFSASKEQKALEQTRRALRQQGFKIDLTEFDFSASGEFRTRAAALTNDPLTVSRSGYARWAALERGIPRFMRTIGSNAALV